MSTTGRIFRCISTRGEQTIQTAAFFEVGKLYREADLDVMGENLNVPDSLLLYANCTVKLMNKDGELEDFWPTFYVDAIDFKFEKAIKPLCLN